MRFDEAYMGWQEKRLTQEQAAEILGVTDRSFRRYAARYEAEGLEGLIDRRIEVMSARGAPADEVMRLVETGGAQGALCDRASPPSRHDLSVVHRSHSCAFADSCALRLSLQD